MMPVKKKFKITDPKDDSDVMGGLLNRDNVYLTAYPRILPGYPSIDALYVGATTMAEYRLSGQRGVYRITRMEDE